jgi:hypothetical protein
MSSFFAIRCLLESADARHCTVSAQRLCMAGLREEEEEEEKVLESDRLRPQVNLPLHSGFQIAPNPPILSDIPCRFSFQFSLPSCRAIAYPSRTNTSHSPIIHASPHSPSLTNPSSNPCFVNPTIALVRFVNPHPMATPLGPSPLISWMCVRRSKRREERRCAAEVSSWSAARGWMCVWRVRRRWVWKIVGRDMARSERREVRCHEARLFNESVMPLALAYSS